MYSRRMIIITQIIDDKYTTQCTELFWEWLTSDSIINIKFLSFYIIVRRNRIQTEIIEMENRSILNLVFKIDRI